MKAQLIRCKTDTIKIAISLACYSIFILQHHHQVENE